MAEDGQQGVDLNAIQVCVRARPLNDRERGEGHRTCVSFDDPTKQVVLTAVDKNTLLQLRGATAKGYAFDKRYGSDDTSDSIYDDCVAQLVESCFKGYNATVLAYGQTGSGKTHTMAGGVGIHGKLEEGITPRVIRHVFSIYEQLNKRAKPGEKVEITASALELYNEDLLDLSSRSGRDDTGKGGWDASKGSQGLKLQERPVGKDGRVVPEVVGVKELKVTSGEELKRFYDDCMDNRSTSSTKLNDRSSRSHAIFTISVHRTIVEVLNELGEDLKARVRTSEFTSKLHLVDLAGSERVKRSGVTGKELKEATHINSGLLALGNVIVALSNEADTKKKGHVPYRDSKLTRLLQDSLGGNSLTVLVSCISPSEMDFEETNNTLKYANRACHIKNTPLPNKYTMLEEDLLPSVPSAAGGLGMVQLQALLEDHEKLKELREKKDRERKEKEARRAAALESLKAEQAKKPGFQRLRATQYDELRRQLASRAANIPSGQVIADDVLKSFGRVRLTASVDGPLSSITPGSVARARPGSRASRGGAGDSSNSTPRRHGVASQSVKVGGKPSGQSFADWLASQQSNLDNSVSAGSAGGGDEDFFEQDGGDQGDGDFIIGEDEASVAGDGQALGVVDEGDAGVSAIIEDDADAKATPLVSKSKFRRARAKQDDESADAASGTATAGGMSASESMQSMSATPEIGGSTTDLAAAAEGDDVVLLEDDEHIIEEDAELEGEEEFDPIQDDAVPRLLARFKVNTTDTLAVFKAVSKEDFKDVIGLLPENTPLPASDKMTYLLARLEVGTRGDIMGAVQRVANEEATMNEAVGPAVGCLMATFGTNMISSCIFEFEDPADLKYYGVDERIELWGLQIPHNSVRPPLVEDNADGAQPAQNAEENPGSVITWTSVDRLNMSIGLLYALCNHATENSIKCGFCVPRPQLLRRWLQAGVRMKQITSALKLIYPPTAHDYEYYKASTVAYFMVNEVKQALEKVLGIVPQ